VPERLGAVGDGRCGPDTVATVDDFVEPRDEALPRVGGAVIVSTVVASTVIVGTVIVSTAVVGRGEVVGLLPRREVCIVDCGFAEMLVVLPLFVTGLALGDALVFADVAAVHGVSLVASNVARLVLRRRCVGLLRDVGEDLVGRR
jgi:hypothetical protein